jgi:hypothetical protein
MSNEINGIEESPEKEIEVVLESLENEDAAVEEPSKSSNSAEDPSSAIEALRAKLKEAETRARDAEERARSESMRARKAFDEVEDTNIHLVNNAIESVRSENSNLKTKMKSALAIGDHDAVADLQEKMSLNSAKLLQLENGLEAMRAQPRQPVQQNTDVLEDFKSKVSRRSAEWAEANPEFIRNPRLFQKVIAAHNLVTADGIQADSDEYFERVESVLGIQRGSEDAPMAPSAPRRASAPAAAPPSAPPSRSSGGPSGNPNTVRLSAAERDAARTFGMTDKEYAQHKLALQKEGRLN